MAVRKFYVEKPKDGYPYDRKANKYYSWGYDIWLNRRRQQERGFFTKAEAEDAVRQLKNRTRNARLGIVASKKTPFLVELFQARADSLTGPERTRVKRVFNLFLSLLPGKLKVTEVKRAHFKAYDTRRTADGVSKATIRREFVPVVSALNSAGEYFEDLEDYRPPRIPWPKVSRLRKSRTITFDERRAILTALLKPRGEGEHLVTFDARRRVGLLLQFALLTISRPGEVAAFRRTDIDWHSGIIRIIGVKTRFVSENPVRTIRITPTLDAILKERSAAAKGDFLFTRGGKITHRMYEIFAAACAENGISYGREKMDGITFQTARHTGTTELLRSNRVDTKTAGAFTGHSDETMTLYYTHEHPQMLEIAGEVLEETMGKGLYGGEFLETVSENN